MSSAGKMDQYDEEAFQERRNTLLYFYLPAHYLELEEALVTTNHLLHALPPTGRCAFLNPLSRKCFVHEVRPATCGLYPFTIDIEEMAKNKYIIAFPKCPGLGHGNLVNPDELRKADLEFKSYAEKDTETVFKFVKDHGFTKMQSPKRSRRTGRMTKEALSEIEDEWRRQFFFGQGRKEKKPKKKLIDPFVQLGVIRSNPLIEAFLKTR